MFCSKCGVQLANEASFCHKCGNKIVAPKKDTIDSPVESNETVSVENFSESNKDNVAISLESSSDYDKNDFVEGNDNSSANNSSTILCTPSIEQNLNTDETTQLSNIANPASINTPQMPNTAPAKQSGLTNKKALIIAGIIAIIIASVIGIIIISAIIGAVTSSSNSSSSYDDSYYDSYYDSYDSDYTSEDTIETLAVTALYSELSDHFNYSDYYDIGSTRYSVGTIIDDGSEWIVRGTFTMYDYYGKMSSTYYNETFTVRINKSTYKTTCTTSL